MALLSSLMVRVGVNADGARRGANRANREMDRMRDHAQRTARDMGRSGGDGGERFGDAAGRGFFTGFSRTVGKLFGKLPDVMRAVAPAAAIGASLLTAIPLLIQAAPAIASLGSAALAAAPALIALKAGVSILKTSFTAIFKEGSAAREALTGLADMFNQASEAGSKAAARGIAPLVAQLRKVAQPVVTKYMEGLGRATNRVQREFLTWAKSTDGIKTLHGILDPLAKSMEDLAPHVSKVAISFARMLGRIMGVSTAMGSKGLGGALDWLATQMDKVNAGSVMAGLVELGQTARAIGGAIRTVAGWIKTLYQAYKMYTTEFGLVADALSVIAMVFGGPIVTAIAAAGLIIRHFDQVKAGWERLKAAFQGDGSGGPIGKAFQDLKAAGAILLPALKTMFFQIRDAVWPVLKDIGTLIKNDLIPTFAELARASAPFVAWLIGVLGPVVASTFKGIFEIIKGTLNIIIGVMKVFIAIFNGDWSKAWEGIKQIARGAGQIVAALIKWLASVLVGIWRLHLGYLSKIWGQIKQTVILAAHGLVNGAASAIRGGVGKVRGAASAVKSGVLGVFRGAGSWLYNAGRSILNGLINGVRSAIGGLRNLLNSVTGMIPDWKGPMRVDMKLLEPTGRAIMSGLTTGIGNALPDVRRALQGVTADIPEYAAPKGVATTATNAGGPTTIVLKSGGSQMDDLLVEMLREAIQDRGGNVQVALGSN